MTKALDQRLSRLEANGRAQPIDRSEIERDAERFKKKITDMIARAEDRPHEEVRRTESVMGEWAWSIRFEKGFTLKEIEEARTRPGKPPQHVMSDLQLAVLELDAEEWRRQALAIRDPDHSNWRDLVIAELSQETNQ